MAMTETFIGQPVLRNKEDPDLLTGQANFIDNMTMAGMAWMVLVRPPYVHATVDSIDTSAATAMPGVIGVYTGADLGLGGLPFVWPITEDIKVPNHYALTTDKIRFNGDAVAVVVMEPRGCLAMSIPSTGESTLWSSTQIPHIAKVTLSGTCGIEENKLRVIAPDVGGGFGSKLNVYAEEAIALALSKRTGRPIKWIEERRENYVATIHGRGVIHDCTIAGSEDGTITGMKFVELADMGAYYQLLTPGIPELGGWVYMGPYNPKAYWFEFTGVLTNCTPTDAYRGAGRPEATYVIERAMDALARRVGKDPAELRRMNLHPPHADAQTSVMGL